MPPDLSKFLIAPMPGLLVRLDVAEGDKVEAGQPLAVVEAMKMENILRAAKSGTVKSISATTGDSLAVDAVIWNWSKLSHLHPSGALRLPPSPNGRGKGPARDSGWEG